MSSFDYNAPAELFLAKPANHCGWALRYAVEDLRTPLAFGAWLQVGDDRFNSVEIQEISK